MNIKNGGQSFFIILIATFILFTLSFVNWTDITKKTFDTNKESSFLKNFNIFSQLLPEDTTITGNYIEIDPALKEAMVAYTNNTQQNVRVDSITGDTIIDSAVIDIKKSIINGEIIIEDYSVSQKGMIKFKAALSQRNIRPVRIAIIGDSYIEGDIFTQNIREQLQTQYGGKGVGALNLTAEEVLVVGDNYEKDIVPAMQIGCDVVWYEGVGWKTQANDGISVKKVHNLADLRKTILVTLN